MRIMIPISGGLDSTVLLHQALRDTAHNVVAVHYREDYNARFLEWRDRHVTATTAIMAWLTDNIRAFEFRNIPIRTTQYDGAVLESGDWRAHRYATHGLATSMVAPDEVWIGLTTWNVLGIHGSSGGILAAFAPSVTVRTPFRTDGLGLFSVRKLIHDSLWPFVVKCDASEGDDCGNCNKCRIYRFYDTYCDGETADVVKRVDQRIARLALNGEDPRRERHVTLDRTDWQEWIDAGADPEE